ncbi:hypothetical protein BLA29_005702 [Euroglyphus maynei]|uniref:Uncharacterized protein n=1 Tax=Euroglyphus maynei TaxID=6958 RepID=A0A1Y3AXX5_EURMA|nr:hypothetical protein BLA29_005702 [Euroglyphus maynei]
MMATLFTKENSKSKMANLLMAALSNQPSLTILANLRPHSYGAETMLQRCQLVSSIAAKKLARNGKDSSRLVNQSCASSSSEQSFDTVIRNPNRSCCLNCDTNHPNRHHRHHQSESKRNPIRSKNSSSSRESLRMLNKQWKRNSAISNNDHHDRRQLAKRIRNRKRSLLSEPNDSVWSEELWVDGPNLQPNSLNVKKKHRIEQWVSTTCKSIDSTNLVSDDRKVIEVIKL